MRVRACVCVCVGVRVDDTCTVNILSCIECYGEGSRGLQTPDTDTVLENRYIDR